jgi:hypothetical protein
MTSGALTGYSFTHFYDILNSHNSNSSLIIQAIYPNYHHKILKLVCRYLIGGFFARERELTSKNIFIILLCMIAFQVAGLHFSQGKLQMFFWYKLLR